jgi:hypothetical protein
MRREINIYKKSVISKVGQHEKDEGMSFERHKVTICIIPEQRVKFTYMKRKGWEYEETRAEDCFENFFIFPFPSKTLEHLLL